MNDHDAAASASFSAQLRERARRGRITSEAEDENPIVAAMKAHTVAMQTGSQVEIDAARETVERLIAEAGPGQPDFGAGARPMPPADLGMSTLLRRAAGYPTR